MGLPDYSTDYWGIKTLFHLPVRLSASSANRETKRLN